MMKQFNEKPVQFPCVSDHLQITSILSWKSIKDKKYFTRVRGARSICPWPVTYGHSRESNTATNTLYSQIAIPLINMKRIEMKIGKEPSQNYIEASPVLCSNKRLSMWSSTSVPALRATAFCKFWRRSLGTTRLPGICGYWNDEVMRQFRKTFRAYSAYFSVEE